MRLGWRTWWGFLLGACWAMANIGAGSDGSKPIREIVLSEHAFIPVIGPVTMSLVDDVIHRIHAPETQKHLRSDDYLLFYIDSPGGSVHAGTHLMASMRFLQNRGVRIGCVAHHFMSMAFILFQTCDDRMIVHDSIGMQHQMTFLIRGELEKNRRFFEFHDRIHHQLVATEIEKIGLSCDEYHGRIAHDWWIYGVENLEQNTADELVVVACADDLYDKVTERTERVGPFQYGIRSYACPLIRTMEISDPHFRHLYDSDHYVERVHTIHETLQHYDQR